MYRETEFEPTAQLLADTLNTDPPPEVEARMRERLDSLRSRMESPTVSPADRRFKSRWWFAGATALAGVSAAALLLAILLLPIGSSSALAQIVEAVAAKTWLHASGTGPDGKPAEMWFSAKRGILGCRTGDSYVFVDQMQGTMDVFGGPATSDSVQRLPLEHVPSQGIDAARQSFTALLGGDLQQSMQAGDKQVLEHETKPIVVDGLELIEHRFVVGRMGRDEPRTESLLRVDPKTSLPISWQMKLGDTPLFDFKVTYPDRGPLTIVALGVPETTRIVDMAPQGEFKQVLIATGAARRRFDDYHAVVVESSKSDRATAWDDVYRIWRKGNLWRVDRCQPNFDVREETPDRGDPKTWWLTQVRSMKSYPREIYDGKQAWMFDPEYAIPRRQDPADPKFGLIDSLKKTRRDEMDRQDPQSPRHMLEMPEFYGYEHLNRGASFGFRAELKATELDKVRMTLVDIIQTRNASPKIISPHRFWLDPNRGSMMVRKEQFHIAKPDQSIGASEVVTAARTPQGLWYPTTVRLIGNSVSLEDHSRSDTFVRYYLEFDSPIPDELFNAESVHAKEFWTQTE